MITVTFFDGQTRKYPKGITLLDISKDVDHLHRSQIITASVNNDIKDLMYPLRKDAKVIFFDMSTVTGMKVYQRNLIFLMVIASRELFPNVRLTVEHSLSKGLYCELRMDRIVTEEDTLLLEQKMREFQQAAMPIIKKNLPREEAAALFDKVNLPEKAELLRQIGKDMATLYFCGKHYDYFYRTMVPDTSYIKYFEILFYAPGFILRFPEKEDPKKLPVFREMPKLASIFLEAERWAEIIECDYISSLNNYVAEGEVNRIIRVSEALHEKKLAHTADYITEKRHRLKMICVAGPSSSGKTTFTQRLAVQLHVNGIKTVLLSIDDYFIDRDKRPFSDEEEADFENLDIIDVHRFNKHVVDLLSGKTIEPPKYNFITGKQESSGKKIRMEENQMLIIEGIHGLNEHLTRFIPRHQKCKIYISPLTQIAIDQHNRIPTTDARLMRRIVRDHHFRGKGAKGTLQYWNMVRRGEEGNIFPFAEEADIMFNSSLIYELAVLRDYLVPLLEEIHPDEDEYREAKRLIRLISFFNPVRDAQIPLNSIMREFIGRSCFYE